MPPLRPRPSGGGGDLGRMAAAAGSVSVDAPPPSHRPRRRRLVSTLLLGSFVAVLGAAVTAPRHVAAQAPPTSALDRLFADSAERVVKVAAAAREALEPSEPCRSNAAIAACECTYSPCASRFEDSLTCSADFGANVLNCGGSNCKASKVDYEHSFVHVGRGLLQSDGGTTPTIARDVCLTRSMDKSVFRSLVSDRQFTYFATSHGVFRVHPGRPSVVVDSLSQCTTWEPRLRPWYSAASSGPKDVVIAVDASAEMGEQFSDAGSSKSTRWTLATTVFKDVLDTLNPRDFVAVVRSDGGASGAVTVGDTGPLMVPASGARQKALQEAFKKIQPSGPLNVTATMQAAFGLLRRSAANSGGRPGSATAGCSRVVIWITGGTDACYGSGACQPGAAAGACTCTQNVLSELGRQQTALSTIGGAAGGLPQAMVATLTVGDTVDDSLARQMACSSSGGVWARVASSDFSGQERDSSTDLTGYYRLLSAARWAPINETEVVFSRLYEGEGGLGQMTTATIPLFSRYSKRVLGVAGADIPISRLTDAAPGSTLAAIEAEVAKRAPACTSGGDLSKIVPPCEVQQLRGVAAACVPKRPPTAARCFRRGATGADLYVALPDDWRTYDAANTFCGTLGTGGRLAPVGSNLDNEVLTPLSGVDGSWVGVRRGMGSSAAAEWVTPAGAPALYNSWTVAPQRENCVAIDRRGLRNNWTARNCGGVLPFICLVPGLAATPPAQCGPGGVTDLEARAPNRSNPLFATGECTAGRGAPTCEEPPPPVNTKPLCPINLESGGNSCTNTCCDGCDCIAVKATPGSSIGTGAVVGIVAGVLILLSLLIGGYWVWRRRRTLHRVVQDDASESGDEYFVMRRSEEDIGKDKVAGDGSDDGDRREAGTGDGGAGGRGGREDEADAEAAYRGRQLEHTTQPEDAIGTRVWSWSPGTFLSPRRLS